MKIHPRKQYLINTFGHDPLTLDDLAECTIALINNELQRPNKFYGYTGGGKVIGFKWELVHQDKISNTHHAPLDGVTNWGGDHPSGVRGYPGWYGRVWVRFSVRSGSFGSDAFRTTLTHTGTGGGGAYDGPWQNISSIIYDNFGHKRPEGVFIPSTNMYSYDYRIFDSDFPKVKEIDEITKIKLWNLLKEKATAEFRHTYLWEDQHTKKLDTEFLAEYKKRA
jgi:hypothetical protein